MKPRKITNNIYIGIDPDLRLLNAAILTTDPQPTLRATLLRRNPIKDGKDDVGVVNAVRAANELVLDVIALLTVDESYDNYSKIILVIESQSMAIAMKKRQKGQNVDYEDIKVLAQVTGCLMGAFSKLSHSIRLVQPAKWKQQQPKDINHGRTYDRLGLGHIIRGGKEPYGVPHLYADLSSFSKDKVNPGDFKDISDSVGLALYGAMEGLE